MGQNDGGQTITPIFPGSFVEEKVGFGRVFKKEAHFSLWLNDTFPLFSRHTIIEMSKKENSNKHGFLVDIDTDDDDIDFGDDD